jgi:triacylglycerol esterase/lipase EstA (alpha/beta hydrolase family)
VNASRLKNFLEKQLPLWREHTGLKDAKVIFLAHSMGGLVARYYLEVLEGWQDCKALVTFGTPYRGSMNAIDFLANGYKLLKLIDLTDVWHSLPSVYQLMPRQPVLKIGDEYQSIAKATLPLPVAAMGDRELRLVEMRMEPRLLRIIIMWSEITMLTNR